MTLLRVEGFDALADAEERFTGSGFSLSSGTYRTGSQALYCPDETTKAWISFASNDQIIIGFAIRYAETLAGATHATNFINVLTDTGFSQFRICNSISGNILVYNRTGVSSYVLVGTSTTTMSINTWYYIEMKMTMAASLPADAWILKINGIEEINVAATTDTMYSGTVIASIGLGGLYNNVDTYYDDMYICDDNGSVNDDFLGDSKVETLYPDGNGNYDQFLGSDANNVDNYLHVDEAQHDGDTSYVEESTATERDSFTFDDVASSSSTIHGISVCGAIKKDGAGTRTGKFFYRRSATDYDGAEFGPAESYTVYEEIWEEDPVTVAAWTKTNIDASEFGILVNS